MCLNPMKHYEVTFIVDPVLAGEDIKATAQTYVDLLKNKGCTIVHVDEMGLKQLAYPIARRHSGAYYCVEFTSETGDIVAEAELAMRRDERILRFMAITLDKYGVKFNEDRRKGLIGGKKKAADKARAEKAEADKVEKAEAAAAAEKAEAAE
jgi:small subunit ribosomal protein S6